MDQRLKVAIGTLCAFLFCLSSEAHGQTLPDGKGKAEFVHNCTACHRADMVTRVKKTPDEWKKSVFEMASRGTDGTKEDLDNVVIYLDTFYAAGKAAPVEAAPSMAASSTSVSGGVTQLIAQRGCLTCHRIEQQGAYLGPTLNGIGARRTADAIRAAIVSPPPTLDASYNIIRFTTADGTTITGRMVSQDDHELRVVDASGGVVAYAKPSLRQFTILHNNPMPSYKSSLTGNDLDGVVRYLGSLPPVHDAAQIPADPR